MKKSSVFDSSNRTTESGKNFEQSRSQDEIILKWEQSSKPLVSICCETFNHSNYIEQCLKGFLNQETTFPFEILIHDDASTDDTAKIIQSFVLRYPKLFKPIFQTENQYSKNVGIWRQIQFPRAQGKYIALCEGDDFWTDPHKLQMQVEWLESHPEYSMCCSDATIKSPTKELNWSCYKKDTSAPIKDIILGGGGFFPTCTLVIRRALLNNYPQYCTQCHVGDYPLQIWAALNGKVWYFSKKTGFYRYAHQGSWTSAQIDYKKQISGWRSEIVMLQGLDLYSSYQFHKFFVKQQTKYILECSIFSGNHVRKKCDIQNIISSFGDIKQMFNFLQKTDLFFAMRLPSQIYRIARAFFSVVGTLVLPSQQRLRQLSIKIQNAF